MSSPATTNVRPGLGEPGTVREDHEHHELSFIRKYIFSTDHKVIGIQFMFLGLAFMVLGGLFAMAIRYQLAWPWQKMPVIGAVLFPNTGEAIGCERRRIVAENTIFHDRNYPSAITLPVIPCSAGQP